MLLNKDMMNRNRLALFRPIPFLLLLIGECAAQEIYTDLIGMKRNHVQVMMKQESFIDYQKSHVTYQLTPEVKQTVLYNADTCKAYYWSVKQEAAGSFEAKLQADGVRLQDLTKVENETKEGNVVIYLVDKKGSNKPQTVVQAKVQKSRPKKSEKREKAIGSTAVSYKASELPPKVPRQKVAWDTVKTVSVLGWKIDR